MSEFTVEVSLNNQLWLPFRNATSTSCLLAACRDRCPHSLPLIAGARSCADHVVVFAGNSDGVNPVTVTLPVPAVARYVRVRPTKWSGLPIM